MRGTEGLRGMRSIRFRAAHEKRKVWLVHARNRHR